MTKRRVKLLLVALAVSIAGLLPGVVSAQTPVDVDEDCGGYGAEYAAEKVRENNDALGRRKAPGMFLPRETDEGRYKVWKEECSKLDLMRDLHAGWRFAVLFAASVFMLSLAYSGILLMVERLSGNGSSQARNVVVGGLFGLLIVAFGMALWRSVLSQVLGVVDLDIGHFNPFGMSGAGR